MAHKSIKLSTPRIAGATQLASGQSKGRSSIKTVSGSKRLVRAFTIMERTLQWNSAISFSDSSSKSSQLWSKTSVWSWFNFTIRTWTSLTRTIALSSPLSGHCSSTSDGWWWMPPQCSNSSTGKVSAKATLTMRSRALNMLSWCLF